MTVATPDDLAVAAVAWLERRKVTASTLLAMIVDLFQRRILQLEIRSASAQANRLSDAPHTFYIKKISDQNAYPWERHLLNRLPHNTAVEISSLSKLGVAKLAKAIEQDLGEYLKQKDYFDENPIIRRKYTQQVFWSLWGLAAVAIVYFFYAMVPLVIMIFALFFIPLMIQPTIVVFFQNRRLTPKGWERMRQWNHFRDDFKQWPIAHFSDYLAYAAAFGKRAQWFRKAAKADQVSWPTWLLAAMPMAAGTVMADALNQIMGEFYEQWAGVFELTVHAYQSSGQETGIESDDDAGDSEGDGGGDGDGGDGGGD